MTPAITAGLITHFGEEQAPHWFAAFTTPQHEQRVAEHCRVRGIELFLPCYTVVCRWNHRRVVNRERPLFPNYVFVRVSRSEQARVLEIRGVLSLVKRGRYPEPLPDFEIEVLRDGIHLRNPEPCAYLAAGDRVRMKSGPFAGLQGVVIRTKGTLRVVLNLDLIMRAITVEVYADEVEPAV